MGHHCVEFSQHNGGREAPRNLEAVTPANLRDTAAQPGYMLLQNPGAAMSVLVQQCCALSPARAPLVQSAWACGRS